MISVYNDFEKNQEEQNDFYSQTFSYSDDELSAMADDYDAYNDALNEEQADAVAVAEDNDEGDPDALGTLVFEGESLYDAPHNFVEPKMEQSATEEETIEESAKEEVVEEKETKATIQPFMSFDDAIKNGLEILAQTNKELAENMKKENKSIKECCNYVLDYVNKHHGTARAMGMRDEDVFNICIEYYADDSIKVKSAPVGVKATSTRPNDKLQKELDKTAKKLNKKKTKAEKKKEEQEKKKAEQIKKLNEPDNLVLPNTKKAVEKVFSGYKKGSKEYNKALEEKSQLTLFDF